MNDKDQIKDLFSEKLGNFEAKVNPELWANIASQVGATTGAAAAGGGMSLLAKAIIGISGAAALTTGVILWIGSDVEEKPANSPNQEISQESNLQNSDNSDNTIVVEPIAATSENSNTPNVSQEPERVVGPVSLPDPIVPITGPNDGLANTGNRTKPDPTVSPAPPVILTSTIDSDDQTTVSQAKKNDIIELKQQHNVAKEDEPTQQAAVIEEDDRMTTEEVEIVFPNVFTPDGDGRNDRYYIVNSNIEFKSFEFVVYDRSGKAVMVTKDADFKWTAFDPQTGIYLEKGVYVFVMIAESINGIQHKKSGTITIE